MSNATWPIKTMIFAAGRGERMRPLTDHTPKPLLPVGDKPLIVWLIEQLAAAGLTDIVINHAWLGKQIEAALGNGSHWGVRLTYSAEARALETAGGIAQALPLLGEGVFLAVSGDIHTAYDFSMLRNQAGAMRSQAQPGMHLVMVPNPTFHPAGDFALQAGRLSLAEAPRYTFGNIALYDTRSFHAIVPGSRAKLGPLYREAILAGQASGELYLGAWHNIGTPDQLAQLDHQLRQPRAAS